MRSIVVLLLLSSLLLACATSTAPPVEPPTAEPTPATILPTAPPPSTTGKLRTVCLVTDSGPVEDGTYEEAAYNGMMQAVRDFDLTEIVEESASPDDHGPNIASCIERRVDSIITISFVIAEEALKSALANPDVKFIGIEQTIEEIPENMVVVFFREDQGGFLAGALACMMTESNVVAGVYGAPFPSLKKFRYGFEHGCHYVNPEATTLGVHLESFTDPVSGAAAALEFMEEGADVIFGAAGPTGSGAIREAAAAGVYVIGVDQDEYETTFLGGQAPGADKILSSMIKAVGVGVYDQLHGLIDPETHLWAGGGTYILDASNGGIVYAPFHETAEEVPEAVKARLADILSALADGSLQTGVDGVSGDPIPAEIPAPLPFEP